MFVTIPIKRSKVVIRRGNVAIENTPFDPQHLSADLGSKRPLCTVWNPLLNYLDTVFANGVRIITEHCVDYRVRVNRRMKPNGLDGSE